MKRPTLVIAARNVLRNRRRTLVTAAVLTAGIAAFIAFDSMLAGMDRMTIDSMMQLTTSALVLRSQDYEERLASTPLEHGIPDPERTIGTIAQGVPSIAAVTPRTKFVATASNEGNEVTLLAQAVDPATDPAVFQLGSHLAKGAWFEGDDPKSVVIGASLASELGLSTGDYLLVYARTVDGAVNADEYRIAGLLRTGSPEIDREGLFMPYPAARELLGDTLPVTELAMAIPVKGTLDRVLKNAQKSADEAKTALTAAGLEGLSLTPIGTLAGDYLAMRNMKAKYSSIIILVVLAIAAVGIINTVLMSVYARVKEIGVLLAYGMERRSIRRLFATEGLLVGAVGSAGGVLLGMGIVWYLSSIGLNLESMMGAIDLGSIPASGILRGEWRIPTMIQGFVFGVFCSWLAALIPARMASRMQAVEALRFV